MKLILPLIFMAYLTITSLNGQVFTFNTPTPIPSAATAFYDLNVSVLPTIMDENFGLEQVCFNITYSQTDDLTIWLIAPDGTEVLLSETNGGPNPNYIGTCFDGNPNNTPIQEGTVPFTGTYKPEQSLSLFNIGTINPNDTWKLKINTNFFRSGTLENYELTFSNNPAVPPTSTNDDCLNSILVPVNNNYDSLLTNSITLANSTASPVSSSCNFSGPTFNDDIWFNFTALFNIQRVKVSNIQGTTNDLIYEVFSGKCGSLISLFCYDGTDGDFTISGLVAGENYYIRIATKTTTPNQNISFDIFIQEGIPPPPSNDGCSGAIALTYNDISGTVAGALPSGVSSNCGENSGTFTNDVWYTFTATTTSQQITVSDFQNGSTDDFDFQLNSGSCGSLQQFGSCFFNPQPINSILLVYEQLVPNSEYHLRIASFDDAPQNTRFKIRLNDPASVPINNACESAIELTVSSSGCNFVAGTIAGATPSGSADYCDDFFSEEFDDDVWFRFTPPSSDINLNVLNEQGSTPNFIFEVYRGSCTNLISILCQNTFNEEIELLGLNTNQEYFIRVASRDDLEENSTFDIRIESNPLEVCTTDFRGPGSFKVAIANSQANDIIRFSPSVNGKAIELNVPTINLTSPLILQNIAGNEIIFKNRSINNTAVLLSIQNQISIEGLDLQSNPVGALKIEVKSGGELNIFKE